MKLLIATHNPAKREEIRKWLSEGLKKHAKGVRLQLLTLPDVGITEDIEEDGVTFEENAIKKATYYAMKSGLPTIADDGGIEIDYLGGRPGVHSKRWAGNDGSNANIISHTLKQLHDVLPEKRGSQLHVVLALVIPNHQTVKNQHYTAEGIVRGIIAEKPYSKHRWEGFPYRQLFYIPEIQKFYNPHDMTEAEEIQYNHRRRAIEKLVPRIQKYL